MTGGTIDVARAEALFVTDLQRSDAPTQAEIQQAIRRALQRHGSVRNCAALVAAEFGDHPETAVARMQWVLQVLRTSYPAAGVPRPREARRTSEVR
jgi:hypothetical protein